MPILSPSFPLRISSGRAPFYRDKLGLEPVEERTGGLRFVCGPTEFHLFSSSGAASGNSTQMGFEVDDLEATLTDLRARGVVFERFEMPGFDVRDDTIAAPDNYPSKGTGELGEFLYDSEGNLIGIAQPVQPPAIAFACRGLGAWLWLWRAQPNSGRSGDGDSPAKPTPIRDRPNPPVDEVDRAGIDLRCSEAVADGKPQVELLPGPKGFRMDLSLISGRAHRDRLPWSVAASGKQDHRQPVVAVAVRCHPAHRQRL